VIPVELLDHFQALEDARDLATVEESKAQATRRASHAEVAAHFGLDPDGTAKR
jgi:hypothetical protein